MLILAQIRLILICLWQTHQMVDFQPLEWIHIQIILKGARWSSPFNQHQESCKAPGKKISL